MNGKLKISHLNLACKLFGSFEMTSFSLDNTAKMLNDQCQTHNHLFMAEH